MIAPGGEEGFFKDAFGGFGEKHAGGAFAAPGAVAWIENGRMGHGEIFLLDRGEFDHGELFVGVGEGGEDFSGDSEVGVVHVLSFFGLRKAKSEAAEVGGSGWHGALLDRALQHTSGNTEKHKEKKPNAEAQSTQRNRGEQRAAG